MGDVGSMRRRMGSKALFGILGLPLLALLTAVAALSMEDVARPPPLAPVPAAQANAPGAPRARPGSAPPPSFLGVLVAAESVDLTAALEGRIESIRVRLGDRVHRGDVIATLDSQALQRELAVAEAELLAARAEEEVATHAWKEAGERLQRRVGPEQLRTGAISEEELATARYQERMASARLNGARAQVLQREAQAKQARQRLSEASVLAPFDGLVASRYVDSGARVSPGRPIVHLLRSDGYTVRFAIPERQAPSVAVGQPARVEVPDHGVVLTGRVLGLGPEVDVAARTVFGLAALEEPLAPSIPSGTVVRVRVLHEPAALRE
ncbi:efflux RND transporter periplasmic adaptor subunit [Corallococcus sp. AB050B]|nr:efflux RND transporter periplasmic adaptor subunit [Corallococcus sp. AB050B]